MRYYYLKAHQGLRYVRVSLEKGTYYLTTGEGTRFSSREKAQQEADAMNAKKGNGEYLTVE